MSEILGIKTENEKTVQIFALAALVDVFLWKWLVTPDRSGIWFCLAITVYYALLEVGYDLARRTRVSVFFLLSGNMLLTGVSHYMKGAHRYGLSFVACAFLVLTITSFAERRATSRSSS